MTTIQVITGENKAEFADVLAEKFPDEPMMIPHRIWTEMWALEGQ